MKRNRLGGTLTLRLSTKSLRLLRARAKKAGRSTSQLARELLERDAEEGPSLWERTRKHIGAVSSGGTIGGANVRELLESWNPDRRG